MDGNPRGNRLPSLGPTTLRNLHSRGLFLCGMCWHAHAEVDELLDQPGLCIGCLIASDKGEQCAIADRMGEVE
jgi:hypothetical protein